MSKQVRQGPLSHQAGATLIETLVALLMSAVGALGLLGWQQRLNEGHEALLQERQALILAQDGLEALRVPRETAATSESRPVVDARGTRYQVQLDLAPGPDAALKSAQVRVQWNDRQGRTRTVQLQSLMHDRPRHLEALVAWRAARATQPSVLTTLP